MTETSTTTTAAADQRRLILATVPIGLMSLGLHMAERHLPIPLGIYTPTDVNNLELIEVYVGRSADDWAGSIDVDSCETVPRGSADGIHTFERSWTGRIAAGIQIRVVQLMTSAQVGATPIRTGVAS